MANIEPTYLRYVFDRLQKGKIKSDNASSLPYGFTGIFEEKFGANVSLKFKQEQLEIFICFALLKKEVSAHFVAQVLGKEEQTIIDLIENHSSWFNSTKSGLFKLYHDRLRVFFLQKASETELKRINNNILEFLLQFAAFSLEFKNYLASELLYHININSVYVSIPIEQKDFIISDEWRNDFFQLHDSQEQCVNELTMLNQISLNTGDITYSLYGAYLTQNSREFFWSNLIESLNEDNINGGYQSRLIYSCKLFDMDLYKFVICLYNLKLSRINGDSNLIKNSYNEIIDLIGDKFRSTGIPIEISFSLISDLKIAKLDWKRICDKLIDFEINLITFLTKRVFLTSNEEEIVQYILYKEFNKKHQFLNKELHWLINLLRINISSNVNLKILSIIENRLNSKSSKSKLVTRLLIFDYLYNLNLTESLCLNNYNLYQRFENIKVGSKKELKEYAKTTKSKETIILLLFKEIVESCNKLEVEIDLIVNSIDEYYFEFIEGFDSEIFGESYEYLINTWLKANENKYKREWIRMLVAINKLRLDKLSLEGLSLLKIARRNLSSYKESLSMEKKRIINKIQYLLIKSNLYDLNKDTYWFFYTDVFSSMTLDNIETCYLIGNLREEFFVDYYKTGEEERVFSLLLSITNDPELKEFKHLKNTLKSFIFPIRIPSVKEINNYLLLTKPHSVLSNREIFSKKIDISSSLRIIDSIKNLELKESLYIYLFKEEGYTGYLKPKAISSIKSIQNSLGYSKKEFCKMLNESIEEDFEDHVRKEQLGYICEYFISEGELIKAAEFWEKQIKLLSDEPTEFILSIDDILLSAYQLKENNFIQWYNNKAVKNNTLMDYYYSELSLIYYRLNDFEKYHENMNLALENKTSLLGLGVLPKAFLYQSDQDSFLSMLSGVYDFWNPEKIFIESIIHFKINNSNDLITYIKKVKKYQRSNSRNEIQYMFELGKNITFEIDDNFLVCLKNIDPNYMIYFIKSYIWNPLCDNLMYKVNVINEEMKSMSNVFLNNHLYASLFINEYEDRYLMKLKKYFTC